MATTTKTQKNQSAQQNSSMGDFFGRLFSFNNSLKLFHWAISGKGSYAEHMALDQAIDQLKDPLDRIVETSISAYGPQQVVIPETVAPSDIVEHCQSFYDYIDDQREMFSEDFSTAILDDYQEGIQQLLYRLRRLQ